MDVFKLIDLNFSSTHLLILIQYNSQIYVIRMKTNQITGSDRITVVIMWFSISPTELST